MKKTFYALTLLGLGLASAASAQDAGRALPTGTTLAADPAMAQRMAAIEAQTKQFEANPTANRTTATVTIPVVFHVLYKAAAENVPTQQLLDQITVLNQDYSKTNTDISRVPTAFAGLAANTNVQFVLAQRDPSGNPTSGIVRKLTKTTSWSTNDAVKNSKRGGDDAWPAGQYLNIWVCNLGQGLLGYAQFPGGSAATDGVVILYSSLPGGSAVPYNKGRTATHEVGHWLNLRHIWGDASCGNDLVSDTPTQQTSNYGCPSFPHVTCSNGANGDMFMNYMDYTDDACMYMFTTGQSSRMNALFASGGARASLVTSLGGTAPRTVASAGSYALYPNPATSTLTLTDAARGQAPAVQVYDIHGQQMKGLRYEPSTGQLDVRSLPKGLYRIAINDGKQVVQKSFMKE